MPNKIQIKRTSVTGRTPNTTSSGNSSYIDAGELAINITDGKLFSSDGTNYIEVGANLNSLSVGSAKLTANATLVNAVALNVVNQTNTATLYVTTSANVGTNVQITPSNFKLGNSSANINLSNTAITHLSSIAFNPQVVLRNSTSDAFGPYWNTGKSRSGGAVQTGDDIGTFMFQGHDGTDFRNTSYIVSEIEGTVSTNIVPSRMDFFTTNTSGNLLNRLTIHANGNVNVNNGMLTVGSTSATVNTSQITLNSPSYTVSFSNTNSGATNYITWSTSLQQAIPSTTTRSLGTKIIFYDGLSATTTDWAYGLAGSEMWASVGATNGTFRWYAVTTAFMTSNTSFLNHTAQVRVGGGVGTTNGVAITNTSITVGNTVTNSFMTPSTLQIGSSITANATSANLLVNTAISAIIANGSIGTSGQVLTSNSTGIYWSTVSGGGGSATKYSASIGNGSDTSITVNHNLNSDNVFVTVIESSTGYYVYPDIKYSTSNSTIFEFVDAPTTNQYKVIIL